MSIENTFALSVFLVPALYGVFAMIFVGMKRYKTKLRFRAGEVPNEAIFNDPAYFKFIDGQKPSQMISFILHITLLIGAVLTVLTINGGGFILFGFALLLLTPATVAANAVWIYPIKKIEAEEYALYTKKASGLLKTERIVAWVTWSLYTAVAVYIAYTVVSGLALFNDPSGYTY